MFFCFFQKAKEVMCQLSAGKVPLLSAQVWKYACCLQMDWVQEFPFSNLMVKFAQPFTGTVWFQWCNWNGLWAQSYPGVWWTGRLFISQGHYKNLSSFCKSLLPLGDWAGWIFLQHLLPSSCKAHRERELRESIPGSTVESSCLLFVCNKPTATTLQYLLCVSQRSLSHSGGAPGFCPLPSQWCSPSAQAYEPHPSVTPRLTWATGDRMMAVSVKCWVPEMKPFCSFWRKK